MKKGVDYIVIPELPLREQMELLKWLIKNDIHTPVIYKEGKNRFLCCLKTDYDRFKKTSIS